jgi:heat shock protein HspQ
MTLDEIPFNELVLGNKVRSKVTGVLGEIFDIYEDENYQVGDEKRYIVAVDWENGKVSCHWHFWFDKVEII